MPVTKKENYTKEMEKILLAGYDGTLPFEEREEQVKQLCIQVGKNVRSVKGKLSSMKVFVKAKPTSKVTGEPAEKKEAMAENLVKLAGVNVSSEGKETRLNAESLAKCNKTDLQFLLTKIADYQNTIKSLEDELFDDDVMEAAEDLD